MLTFLRRRGESDSERGGRRIAARWERAGAGDRVSAPPPEDTGRGGARRILPSVSEVASSLARLVSADPAALYRVAREVVAEELTRVKQGLESASLETLVERAHQRYLGTAGKPSAGRQPDLFAGAPPSPLKWPEPAEAPMPVLPAPYEAPEEPFAPASKSELGWDRPGQEVPGPAASPSSEIPLLFPPLRGEPNRPSPGDEQTLPVDAADVEVREHVEDVVEAEPAPLAGDGAVRRRLWILAVIAFALVAAGVVWLLLGILPPGAGVLRSEGPTRVEVPSPPALPVEPAPTVAPIVQAGPQAVPAAPPPAPAPVPPKASPAKPAVPKPEPLKPAPVKPASAPQVDAKPKGGRAAPFTTKDWKGRPAVFVVHFSSHQDRAAAVAAAARLGAELGKPARAVEVDLGAKGIWYRVVVGEFRTADEARAFRAALAAKKTPGMGFVYEMRGSR